MKYRCACCNKMKSRGDQFFRLWDHRDEEGEKVAICHTCAEGMKKYNRKSVYDYLTSEFLAEKK